MSNNWIVVASLIASLSLLLLASIGVSFLPGVYTQEAADLFARGRTNFPREYDLPLFRFFIISTIALALSAFFLIHKRSLTMLAQQSLKITVVLQGLLALLGYTVFYQWLIKGNLFVLKVIFFSILAMMIAFWRWWSIGPLMLDQWRRVKPWLARDWFLVRVAIGIALIVIMIKVKLLLNYSAVPALPYFFPLKYQAVAIFTLSFVVPIVYVLVILALMPRLDRGWGGGLWALALSVMGLVFFITYIRYPLMFWFLPAASMVIVLAAGLMTLVLQHGFIKTWELVKQYLSIPVWLSVLTGIQCALLVFWAHEMIPISMNPFYFSMTVYLTFIATALLSYKFWDRRDLTGLEVILWVQAIVVVLMSIALFKLIVYDYRARLATSWFKLLGMVTILMPVIILNRRSILGIGQRVYTRLLLIPRLVIDLSVMAVLALIVYIPNVEALTAHIFFGEYMHHTDTFFMGPAWALANGHIIDVDTFSRYGIGSIHVFLWFMKQLGGITYTHLFAAIVGITTVYFVLLYVFLRRWLKGGVVLAIACWMMAFKAQIAFELAFPIVYTYPQATAARFWPDIVWMLCMEQCLRTKQQRWLLMASLVAGFTCWYMLSVGVYLLVAQGAMTLMMALSERKILRKVSVSLWPTVVAIVSAAILFWAICGQWFFSALFWHNAFDFVKTFLLLNTVPLTDTLKHQQYIDALMFVVIVGVYITTIIKVMLDFCAGNNGDRRGWLALGLSVYGLGLLEHYVTLSLGNNYYTKIVPFFCVVFFWVDRYLERFSLLKQQRIKYAMAIMAVIALVTHHAFTSYPNIFSPSKDPLLDRQVARPLPDGRPYFNHKDRGTLPPAMLMPFNSLGQTDEGLVSEQEIPDTAALINRYARESDFSEDAQFIASLSEPHQPVALLSSYDVRLLILANRRPYFFYFPIVASRPMKARSLPNDIFDAKSQMQRVINDLERDKPQLIFIEKIMLNDIPEGYKDYAPGLVGMLDYIKIHYEPYQWGHFLVAMKRR